MDALNAPGGIPSGDGMSGLLAALGGGGPGAGPDQGGLGGPADEANPNDDLDAIGHIQEAMKHLMMAMGKSEDEGHGLGITKGMGALQGILAGEQKKGEQRASLGPSG